MPKPRRLPRERTTFAVCRRVQERQFLLRPDAKLTAMITWLIAACAEPFDIELHAVTVMSTHFHMVLSCEEQRVSAFMELLDANLAKAVNVLRGGRRGIVFEPNRLGIVELKTVDAVVFEMAYTIVNPVAAGLVWSPEDWPGLSVQLEEIGVGELSGTMPSYYFCAKTWPMHAARAVVLPACLLELGEATARRRLDAEVERQVGLARSEIKASRWKVLGPIGARAVSPLDRAKSEESFGALHPHFATGPGRVKERIEAARELKTFRADYRAAWERYKAGERDVVFPCGTYLMRVRHGVRVADS